MGEVLTKFAKALPIEAVGDLGKEFFLPLTRITGAGFLRDAAHKLEGDFLAFRRLLSERKLHAQIIARPKR